MRPAGPFHEFAHDLDMLIDLVEDDDLETVENFLNGVTSLSVSFPYPFGDLHHAAVRLAIDLVEYGILPFGRMTDGVSDHRAAQMGTDIVNLVVTHVGIDYPLVMEIIRLISLT